MPESAIVAAVHRSAARVPERPALIAGEIAVPYAELERRAAGAAAHIAEKARGDIVGLFLPNGPAFVWTLLGALRAGKTVAVLPTLAPPPLLALMAAEAGLQTVLTAGELAPRLADAKVAPLPVEQFPAGAPERAPANRPLEAAVLLYTSGTTGRPKAVALSDANILTNADGCRVAAGFGNDEVMLAILPLFHAYGLTVTLFLPLMTGGTVVFLDRFAPRAVLQTIEQRRVSVMVAVPSQYRLLTREPTQADTRSLWLCISGAERLSEIVAQDFEARFHQPILQGYGATEAAPVVSMNSPTAHRPHTVGRPLPDVTVTLREDGRALPAGEIGEVCVEGPNVMLGYHNQPQATAEKIVNGVLRTGDRGFFDPDGFLHIAGRTDDLLKVAGEKIYPSEVERAIEQVAGVEEAAVVGVPDEVHGAVLRAFVQAKPGVALTEAALRAACREHLEANKLPRSFTLVEQMPRTPGGKVDKRALASQGA